MKAERILFISILSLLSISFVFADAANFNSFMEEVLTDDTKYLQKVNRLDRELAENKIERSVNWFDINLSYRKYSNDKIRKQTETTLEYSDIDEEDERWRLELSKRLFPKDYDNVSDDLNARIDILRLQHEVELYRISRMDDIIDDLIESFEAASRTSILKDELTLLNRENLILEELQSKNITQPEELIKNIKELNKKENELAEWEEIISMHTLNYFTACQKFDNSFSEYVIITPEIPDTILFQETLTRKIEELNKKIRKISGSINWKKNYFFFPEFNISLSYNNRKTYQDWNITENSYGYLRERNFEEKYPEGEIELSLPFDIFSNISGKKQMLNSFENEIQIWGIEMITSLQSFELERINSFQKALNNFKRKKRLWQLYNEQFLKLKAQFDSQPELLGTTPEIKLLKEEIKMQKAELEYKISEMKLYKEIFLINYFGEN
ncbi:MAG: hypothetical protein ISS80_06675 [Candidatus Cloacimonetes bacterium]|nr:hypothetical protein [Candidatus Cloacimonadota bacterium]MBL7149742.1 hypothetical protein [Candidatus Cloacimonadota bacterium]